MTAPTGNRVALDQLIEFYQRDPLGFTAAIVIGLFVFIAVLETASWYLRDYGKRGR